MNHSGGDDVGHGNYMTMMLLIMVSNAFMVMLTILGSDGHNGKHGVGSDGKYGTDGHGDGDHDDDGDHDGACCW